VVATAFSFSTSCVSATLLLLLLLLLLLAVVAAAKEEVSRTNDGKRSEWVSI
jgi:hypothetical protein